MIAYLLAASAVDLVYVGPRVNQSQLVATLKQASNKCGIAELYEPRSAWVEVLPHNATERVALDQQTFDVMEKAGFARDRKLHPTTFVVTQKMLATRTFVRFAFVGNDASKLCLDLWLRENNFQVLSEDQLLPPELKN